MGEANSFITKNTPLNSFGRLEQAMYHNKKHKPENPPPKAANYIDAHIHLADPGYAGKVDEVVQDATQHNVSQILSNATDYQSSLDTINLAKKFPQQVLAAVGVHPSTVVGSENLHLEEFGKMIDVNREWVTAIGEIGLDGKYTQDEQIKAKEREVFRFFLGLAEERSLPVAVHSRQAISETLDSLRDFRLPGVLLHWYDGPTENLSHFKDRGYMISIGPALLYSRRIAEIARTIEANLILTETDGPVNYRGIFANELTKPRFVVEVVRKLVEVRGSTDGVMRSTIFSNFQRFLSV